MKPRYLPFALLLLVGSFTLNAQWTSLGSGITTPSRAMAGVFPVNENVIWGFAWHSSSFTPTHEFTRTTDGGETWLAGTLNGVAADQFPIYIFPLDGQTAWLATADEQTPIKGHIYKTTDGGNTWVQKTTGFTGINETPAGIWFWNDNEGFAYGAACDGSNNEQIAIYTTDDGGENWAEVAAPDMPAQLPGEGMCIWNLTAFFSVAGDNIWFGTNKSRVFKSADRGHTWEVFGLPFSGNTSVSSIYFKDNQNGMALSLNPFGIARTADGGQNWELLPGSYPANFRGAEIDCVPGTQGTWFIVPSSNKYMVSHDDGEHWEIFDSNIDAWSVQFLNAATGFAGSYTTNPALASVFKWTGQPLGNRIFVNDDATGLNNGASWADAFNSLQSALAAATDGGQIWVAKGLYLPGDAPTSTFLVDKNIHLYGGFAGTEATLAERGDPAEHPAVLSGDVNGDDVADDFVANRGDNVMTVVEIAPGISNATVIDGFTIRNGHADGAWPQGKGAGILSTGAPVIRNCLFTQNYAEEQGGAILHNTTSTQSIIIEACIFDKNAGRFGGAVDVYYSGYRIDNCIFSGNVAEWELGNGVGGGLLINGASGAITNCTFENNTADKGGGIFVSSWVDVNDVALVLENSTFNGNTAAVSGGGLGLVLTDSIQAVVRNCIFQNNSCVSGAGVGISVFEGGDFTENADILFENCLMAGNEGEEGTIHFSNVGNLKLVNCTIAGNPAGGIVQNENSALALQNTILYNPGFTEYAGAAGNAAATSLGGNLIRDNSFAAHALQQDLQPMYDPQAMFMGDDDYHLHPGSPCINRGVNDGVTALYDLDGEDRIQHGIVDIGAYESPFVTSAREAIVGEIGLSPNPATDFLYLQLPETVAQPVEVGLFDASGKMVGSQVLTTGQPLELKGLVPGMYWVKVVLDDQVYTGKFSKF